jgi:hypothetical protein
LKASSRQEYVALQRKGLFRRPDRPAATDGFHMVNILKYTQKVAELRNSL